MKFIGYLLFCILGLLAGGGLGLLIAVVLGGIVLMFSGGASVEELGMGENVAAKVRQCPYCAEDIKYEAVICKHCGKDVKAERPPEKIGTASSLKVSLVALNDKFDAGEIDEAEFQRLKKALEVLKSDFDDGRINADAFEAQRKQLMEGSAA